MPGNNIGGMAVGGAQGVNNQQFNKILPPNNKIINLSKDSNPISANDGKNQVGKGKEVKY